jgi:hypothetical protein
MTSDTIRLLNKFGKAVNALSNRLHSPEKEKIHIAWSTIQNSIQNHSYDFESLAEYRELIQYLKKFGDIDPFGREFEP